jgi:hypothetical protein
MKIQKYPVCNVGKPYLISPHSSSVFKTKFKDAGVHFVHERIKKLNHATNGVTI